MTDTSAASNQDQNPGALHVPSNSPPPKIRLFEYDQASLTEKEIADPEELQPYSNTPKTTWIDVQGLGDADRLQTIGRVLAIHDLALADAVNVPQRAKVQRYSEHYLIIIRAPLNPFNAADGVPQVCILIANDFVISFQERYFGFFDDVRQRLRNPESPLRDAGNEFLAHALIDALIDSFYPVVDGIADELDELEETILDRPTPDLVSRLHRTQRKITVLRRVLRPEVESLSKLASSQSGYLSDPVRLYMKDVQDHAQQIQGRLDSSREIATDMMSAVLATLGHRQNEVMKVLTLVGSIFIPLTFIAGIYGMNFEHMPELKFRSGYPFALGAMGIVAVGMVLFFRARGWIGGSRRH